MHYPPAEPGAEGVAITTMHEPIRFHQQSGADAGGEQPPGQAVRPRHIDLKKDANLTIQWSDGRVSIYPIALLRKLSPSAEARELRKEMERNPLTVLPASQSQAGPLTALGIDVVGNYAIRIRFSDGHETGIYTWPYLRQIDPNQPSKPEATGG